MKRHVSHRAMIFPDHGWLLKALFLSALPAAALALMMIPTTAWGGAAGGSCTLPPSATVTSHLPDTKGTTPMAAAIFPPIDLQNRSSLASAVFGLG